MANIKISDLNSTGANLFMDSESYLDDLRDEEMTISGGCTPIPIILRLGTIALSTWVARRRG